MLVRERERERKREREREKVKVKDRKRSAASKNQTGKCHKYGCLHKGIFGIFKADIFRPVFRPIHQTDSF